MCFWYQNRVSYVSAETGVHRSQLVRWYLEQISDQIESEEELVEKKVLIEKIIDRLIYNVSILEICIKNVLSMCSFLNTYFKYVFMTINIIYFTLYFLDFVCTNYYE